MIYWLIYLCESIFGATSAAVRLLFFWKWISFKTNFRPIRSGHLSKWQNLLALTLICIIFGAFFWIWIFPPFLPCLLLNGNVWIGDLFQQIKSNFCSLKLNFLWKKKRKESRGNRLRSCRYEFYDDTLIWINYYFWAMRFNCRLVPCDQSE